MYLLMQQRVTCLYNQSLESEVNRYKIRPGLGPVKYLQVSPDIGSREMVRYAAGCSTCSEVSCSTANLSWLESVVRCWKSWVMTELGGLGCRSGSLASLRGRWCIVIVIPKPVSSGRAISTCRPVLHVRDHAAPAAPRPTPQHSPSRGGLSYG